MIDFIEKSISLRILNYVRVSHGYWRQYNLYMPAVPTIVVGAGILFFRNDANLFASGGLVAGFTQVLAILAPFYIAALAAVSTLAGNIAFDREFQMKDPLEIRHLSKALGSRDLLLFGNFSVFCLAFVARFRWRFFSCP